MTLSKTVKIMRAFEVGTDKVWFDTYDPDENPPFTELGIPVDVYEDMGQPDTITVTIEPGDKLNA